MVYGGVIFMEGVVGDDYILTLITFLLRPLTPRPSSCSTLENCL